MTPLHTIDEIVAATGAVLRGPVPAEVSSVSIDSRDIAPGALFVAIRGDNFDGHDFVAAAIAAGAGAALVSAERADGLDDGLPLLVVPDALDGLRRLGEHARRRSAARVIAVTGSAGKTTTREMIRAVLGTAGMVHASVKSFNNHWGVPLTLARMPREADFGVFEIGMNHEGEIAPLSRMVRPHVAVVTTVAPAHLEFFDGVEGIARAKAEIFEGLEPDGAAILGADEHVDLLADVARAAGAGQVIRYGEGVGDDWRITGVAAGEAGGMAADIVHAGRSARLGLAVEGGHMVRNAVAALAAAEAVGLDALSAPVVDALAGFEAPDGRGVALVLGEGPRRLVLIDESYNANPASMRVALERFAMRRAEGRKVLVLGEMRELGPQSRALHAGLAEAVAASGAERVYLVGRDMAALAERLDPGLVAHWSESAEAAVEPVLNGLALGDLVMVKGSNGVRLGGLIARIRDRFAGGEQSAETV